MPRSQRLDLDADDFDENGILKDGHSVRVPMTFVDQQLRDHLHRQHPSRFGHGQFCGPVVDATGDAFWVGHRAGFCLPSASNAETASVRQRALDAHSERSRQLADAWKAPQSPQPPSTAPQMTAQRDDASRGYQRLPPRPTASTVTVAADDDAVRDAAEQARADRHRRDLEAWRS